jgi:radical SAM-linked protein
MRDVITKNVTEEDIIESAHRVFSRGFQRMKLYFMIGLPTETDEDVRGIVETAARVQAIGRSYFPGAAIVASVSTHVPKPHTPFQWAAMDSEEETARKQQLLAETARRLRVELKMHENAQSHLEAIFSRGDREVADILERAFRLGCRFDGWDDQLRMDLWDQAIAESTAEAPIDLQRYLGTIPVTSKLPWDHIDIALEDGFLAMEYRKALKDRLSPPCGKPYKKLLHPSSVEEAEAGRSDKLICYDCGVACDLKAMKEERLTYLRRMNAWTKPVALPGARLLESRVPRKGRPAAVDPEPATEATADAIHATDATHAAGGAGDADGANSQDGAAAGPRRARPARPAPPTRAQQGEPIRMRLRYTKLGRVAYLGHLDLVRHLPRIFRRAGLELFYSVGFHPKPELTYGPALGLGIPSLCELLDVKLTDEVAPDELVERLQAVTIDGVRWLSAVRLGDNDRALGRVLARSTFWARLPVGSSAAEGLARWSAGEPIRVKRTGEGSGVGRMVDVRQAVRWLGPPTPSLRDGAGPDSGRGSTEDSMALRLERLGWNEEGPLGAERVLEFQLAISTDTSARPIEVVEGLFGPAIAREASLARVALSACEEERLLDPLDVVAFRRLPSPKEAAPAAE